MATSNEAALYIKLIADKAGLDVVLKDAEGSVINFEKAINKGTTSQMRSWRESNRMSGSLNNMALQFGGVNRQASMAFGVMDNLGDYFERAAIRGDSVKTALKNLSGEMSMMVTGGLIAAAGFAFKAVTDYIANMNKQLDATEKLWADIQIMQYEQRLKSLNREYAAGTISASAYLEQTKKLNEVIVKTKYAEEINKLQEQYNKLNKNMTTGWKATALAAISQEAYLASIKISGTEMSVLSDKLTALQTKRDREIKYINEETEATVKNTEAQRALVRAKKLPDIPLGPDMPKDFNKKVNLYAEFDDMIAQHRQDTLEQIADYEEQQRQESIDRVQGYYNTVSTSLANATVSSLTSGIQAWRDWAKNVIAEIERVILKQLFLNAITSMFGGAAGGGGILGAIGNLLTGGSKAGAVGGSPQIQIMPISGNISAEGQLAFVKFANTAYGNSTPKAQVQLYRNVQRGAMQDYNR